MTRHHRLALLGLTLLALTALAGCRAHTAARAAGDLGAPDYTAGHSRGPAEAPVVIDGYQEFQCPYCRRSAATIEQVLAQYPGQVRYVFHHFPLDFHQQARPSAKAAIAAEEQGRFWAFHDLLVASADDGLEKQDLLDAAAELQLDPERFVATMRGDAADRLIDADIARGKELGVTGVPAFYINGRELRGSQPLEKFVEIIDEELLKAEQKRRQGIPAHLISAVLTQENRQAAEVAKATEAAK